MDHPLSYPSASAPFLHCSFRSRRGCERGCRSGGGAAGGRSDEPSGARLCPEAASAVALTYLVGSASKLNGADFFSQRVQKITAPEVCLLETCIAQK